MGRELRRVPLDFDWPLEKVWKGYINPHYEACKTCNGSGETIAYQRLSDLVSLLMLSGENARSGKCHPYFFNAPLYYTEGKVCGPDMTELTEALAGRSMSFLGHDSCDRWSAIKKITQAAGLPESWGTCPDCGGHGCSKEKQAIYEAWEQIEPPTGEGYQIWETVSEGSPISPVFDTPEKLARYMTGRKWGADEGTSYETWLKFINGPGWAPSGAMTSKGFFNGVEASVMEDR